MIDIKLSTVPVCRQVKFIMVRLVDHNSLSIDGAANLIYIKKRR